MLVFNANSLFIFSIALGDSSDKSKVIAVDIANDYIYVPADYYQIVYKQTDNHVVKADAKLTSFKITVGSDVLELKPELYTMKGADGKVRVSSLFKVCRVWKSVGCPEECKGFKKYIES